MAAMAQTVPVITGGLDLAVGPVITLVNCLASRLVSGTGGQIALRDRALPAGGDGLRLRERLPGRLRPPAADHRDAGVGHHLSRDSRCSCGQRRAARSTAICRRP